MDAAEILKDHRQRLVNIIRRWCRNSGDLEDILQNIMLKIHAGAARYEGRASLATWLYRVAVNESIDFFRKNRRFTEGRVEIDGLYLADRDGNPEKDAEIREKMRMLDGIVDGLPEESRTVFTLYFLSGLSIDELAGTLNISRNAVRCRIYKAKQRILLEAAEKGLANHDVR